ncbi:hypothetical protein [Cupriavidus necator]|uniref:hypothetical protein n=1 Tax=Cupriavidus necator TaxID=106590 RepID=UPI0005B50E64|nr:hypothetical protein [Cupriavidus necator]
MLSPHELATLMLIKSAPGHSELDPLDLEILLQEQLVHLETRPPAGKPAPVLTQRGHLLLGAMERLR